jgi:hypothetical protein
MKEYMLHRSNKHQNIKKLKLLVNKYNKTRKDVVGKLITELHWNAYDPISTCWALNRDHLKKSVQSLHWRQPDQTETKLFSKIKTEIRRGSLLQILETECRHNSDQNAFLSYQEGWKKIRECALLTHFHFAKLPPLHIQILYYLPETHAKTFAHKHRFIRRNQKSYLRKHELVFHNRLSIVSTIRYLVVKLHNMAQKITEK